MYRKTIFLLSICLVLIGGGLIFWFNYLNQPHSTIKAGDPLHQFRYTMAGRGRIELSVEMNGLINIENRILENKVKNGIAGIAHGLSPILPENKIRVWGKAPRGADIKITRGKNSYCEQVVFGEFSIVCEIKADPLPSRITERIETVLNGEYKVLSRDAAINFLHGSIIKPNLAIWRTGISSDEPLSPVINLNTKFNHRTITAPISYYEVVKELTPSAKQTKVYILYSIEDGHLKDVSGIPGISGVAILEVNQKKHVLGLIAKDRLRSRLSN